MDVVLPAPVQSDHGHAHAVIGPQNTGWYDFCKTTQSCKPCSRCADTSLEKIAPADFRFFGSLRHKCLPLSYGSRSLPVILQGILDSIYRKYYTLLSRRVLLIGLGHMGLLVIAVVNQYAITKHERFPLRNRPTPVIVVIAGKLANAKRIHGEQPVASRVPIGWVAKAFRAVKNSNPKIFIAHLAVIINPACALSPDLFFSHAAFRIH